MSFLQLLRQPPGLDSLGYPAYRRKDGLGFIYPPLAKELEKTFDLKRGSWLKVHVAPQSSLVLTGGKRV